MWYWAEYSTFYISDEVEKYRLSVDGYSGDALLVANPNHATGGKMFTTADDDNDTSPRNCAKNRGGWWYGRCSVSLVNMDDNSIASWMTSGIDSSRILMKLI